MEEHLCAGTKNDCAMISSAKLAAPRRAQRSGIPSLGGPKSSDQQGFAQCPKALGARDSGSAYR